MKRREFITLIGGAAATWSRAARAQQSSKPVLGMLHARSPEESTALVGALKRGLAEEGYVDGQNLTIEYRWGRGQYDRMPALAAELVGRPVNVILAGSEPSVLAAKAATSTIPLIFVVGSDPLKLGVVSSYNKPGGNATGLHIFSAELEAKRLSLLHELVPNAQALGVLVNPNFPYVQDQLAQVQAAANIVALRLQIYNASTPAEIDAAFDLIAQDRIPALNVSADPFFDTCRDQLLNLAAQRALPVIYQFRQYAAAGGLMSYGIDLPDAYRLAGVYVGRVLKGAKPAELPVLQPTKFEFVINLKTAKALGLMLPSGLLAIADEVIE